MEDSKIVDLFFARNEDAIAETQQKYGWYCTSIAYNILSSIEDSEECVSDAFLNTWNSIPPKRPDNLKAYVGRITRNLSLNRLKSNRARTRGEMVVVLEELQITSIETPDDEMERRLLSDTITEFLHTLTPVKQQMFVLRYWYIEPIESISKKTGWKSHSIRSELYRLRKQLERYLREEGFSYET